MRNTYYIFKSMTGIFFFSIMASSLNSCEMKEAADKPSIFVGTYTDNGSEGIYRFQLNTKTGQLEAKTLAAPLKNPSYLAISPDKKTLYAVSEVDDYDNHSGSISTFSIKDTLLTKIDVKSTFGAHPCHVTVDESGRFLATSNYTGGTVSIYSVSKNGQLRGTPQIIDHKVLDTGKTAHAHMAKFLDDELIVSDLGLDQLKRYKFQNDSFEPNPLKDLTLIEGSGPRHFEVSKDGNFIYVINELNSTISVFNKQGDDYTAIETYKTTAPDFDGESYCADIHLSPDGKFLYGSNRGENTLVIFSVDTVTGTLELLGRASVKGDWPRNFSLDPSGKFVLVANQRTNNIVVFKRNITKGTLDYMSETSLPSPVCIQFY